MDTSHVALVSLYLNMDGFAHYRADQSQVIGVSVQNLAKVMRLAGNDDQITLQADNDPSHLKITFYNSTTERTTTFQLNLITLDSEHLAIPETEYSSVVTLNSSEFSKICKELYTISEAVTLTTNPEFVQFSVEGDIASGCVKLCQNDSDKKEDMTKLEVSDSVNQQFALRYLNMFNKAAPLSSFTRLCLHSEQPLVVEFGIDNLGALKYYLAPKITDE